MIGIRSKPSSIRKIIVAVRSYRAFLRTSDRRRTAGHGRRRWRLGEIMIRDMRWRWILPEVLQVEKQLESDLTSVLRNWNVNARRVTYC